MDSNQNQDNATRNPTIPIGPRHPDDLAKLKHLTKDKLIRRYDDLGVRFAEYHFEAQREIDTAQREVEALRDQTREAETHAREMRYKYEKALSQKDEQIRIYKTMMLIEAKRQGLEFASENEVPF